MVKDTKSAKGIQDPWRMHTGEREVKDANGEVVGSHKSSHPMDADLLPHCEYFLRMKDSIGDFIIYGSKEGQEAVDRIANVIKTLGGLESELEQQGILVLTKSMSQRTGFTLYGDTLTINYAEADSPLDGFNHIFKCLRRSMYAEALKRAGIITVLK